MRRTATCECRDTRDERRRAWRRTRPSQSRASTTLATRTTTTSTSELWLFRILWTMSSRLFSPKEKAWLCNYQRQYSFIFYM
ncbi:unnamed protein product [Heligmosomoides polygyrus]|uniref:Uncharacterized protein n=1 Tax=Heligmosomoides polygyrus TaxID=6339 RepID=A0A183F323_HELPZ|nr:unnamed protein product [Heligmosomoides polygyrus]